MSALSNTDQEFTGAGTGNEKLKQEASDYTICIAEYYANVEGEQQETLEDIVTLSRV